MALFFARLGSLAPRGAGTAVWMVGNGAPPHQPYCILLARPHTRYAFGWGLVEQGAMPADGPLCWGAASLKVLGEHVAARHGAGDRPRPFLRESGPGKVLPGLPPVAAWL